MNTVKLNNGTEIPAIGFGVFLIPDDGTCEKAVSNALEVGYRFIDTASNIGGKYNKTVSQIILRWHVEEGIIPIPKSTSMNHIKENFDIFDFSLDSDDMVSIRSINTGVGSHNPDDLSWGDKLLNAFKIED